MKEQTKYDVFISYSRKDYVVNDEIISGNPISAIQELFDKNDVKYWFDKDGIYSGEEFVKEISTAIVNSKMLVFVSSKNSNESEYTCGEILKAKKAKKLIIPFLIDECEYNEKFEILLLPLNHIDYVNQPNTALPELLRTVNKEKERIRLFEEKQNEEILKEQKKQEISAGVKDFQRLNGEQDFLLRSLYSKSKDVGAKTKCCPICDREVSIDVPFCESCGWSFASLYGVYGVEGKSLHDEKQLRIVRGLWQDSKQRLNEIAAILEEERKKNKSYAEQSEKLEKTVRSLEQENQAQQERIKVMESEFHETVEKLNSTQKSAKHFEQQYLELWLRVEEEKERKLAEEKREDEEKRLAEKRKYEEERQAEEERKRRKKEEQAKEITFTVGGVSFKMIRVEGGNMGTFYIGETQVTQALWQVVMGNNPSRFKGQDHPVECVSWNDICGNDGSGTDPNCFLYKLNKETGRKFRLPKELEWLYAAKGGNKSKYTYAGCDNIDEVSHYMSYSSAMSLSYRDDRNLKGSDDDTYWDIVWKKNSRNHSVKQSDPNELGIYDMSRNVWEWCQDLYDPMGSKRVIRGGGWIICDRRWVAGRDGDVPGDHLAEVGFRLSLVQ